MAMLGRNGIVVVFIACAIGAAAGWFAERAWGKSKCENVEVCKCENVRVCKYENVETANEGRASRPATADAAAEKPNVTETELAALRDKAAALARRMCRRRAATIRKKTSLKYPRMKRWKNARRTGN